MGYFGLAEFEEMNRRWLATPALDVPFIERDLWWKPKTLGEVRAILVRGGAA